MLSYIIGFFRIVCAILWNHGYFARSYALLLAFHFIVENTAHIPRILSGIFWRNHCSVMHMEFLSAVFVAKHEAV